MKRHLIVFAAGCMAVCLAFAIGAMLAHPVSAQPKADAPAAGAASPVVAAFPYRYDTEFEPDPFETTRLRRSRTEVSHVLIVRADGTQEIKACK